jgi:hypothetical protein
LSVPFERFCRSGLGPGPGPGGLSFRRHLGIGIPFGQDALPFYLIQHLIYHELLRFNQSLVAMDKLFARFVDRLTVVEQLDRNCAFDLSPRCRWWLG